MCLQPQQEDAYVEIYPPCSRGHADQWLRIAVPVSHSDNSPFFSYEEARTAVAALVPMQSTKAPVQQGGVDFAKQPNAKFLTIRISCG